MTTRRDGTSDPRSSTVLPNMLGTSSVPDVSMIEPAGSVVRSTMTSSNSARFHFALSISSAARRVHAPPGVLMHVFGVPFQGSSSVELTTTVVSADAGVAGGAAIATTIVPISSALATASRPARR